MQNVVIELGRGLRDSHVYLDGKEIYVSKVDIHLDQDGLTKATLEVLVNKVTAEFETVELESKIAPRSLDVEQPEENGSIVIG